MSLRGLTCGGRESKIRVFVARYVRDSRLRRGSGIVVNGERCGRVPMTMVGASYSPLLRFSYDPGSANRGRRTPVTGGAAGAAPDLIRPTFAPACHQPPEPALPAVSNTWDHVLTRQEEPLWFPDSFR